MVQLEEPLRATTPLVPCQPLLLFRLEFRSQLRPYNILEPPRNSHVVAVSVHLDQLEIPLVEIPVEEVLVKLEYPQLCQLVNSDLDLKGPVDCDQGLPAFQLVRSPDLVKKC